MNNYERYKEYICNNCINKDNKEDLCHITKTIDNSYKCINYEKCMKNKCKTCKDCEKCNEECKEDIKNN